MSGVPVPWYSHMTPGDRWEDLRVPATAINPPGAVADPDWDTTLPGWRFDGGSTEEMLDIIVQMPHAWREGSSIVPHVHWSKTTSAAGDVRWVMQFKWAAIGEQIDANWTTLTAVIAVAGTSDTNAADKHLISSFGMVSAAGKHVSDMLLIKLSRDPTDDADTYGADARLFEFDIHYIVDAHGSEQQFIKQGTRGGIGI